MITTKEKGFVCFNPKQNGFFSHMFLGIPQFTRIEEAQVYTNPSIAYRIKVELKKRGIEIEVLKAER